MPFNQDAADLSQFKWKIAILVLTGDYQHYSVLI
jgi:hypothetical protein